MLCFELVKVKLLFNLFARHSIPNEEGRFGDNRHTPSIDLFRGACAFKGNVQVAGHVKPAPFSRRDVTLGDVDGSLFHIKI